MKEERDVGSTPDRRRKLILRAALEVIAERGYEQSRIADVASRAGVSPALVVYYFKTKDQLLTHAIRYSEDTWYQAGTRRAVAQPTSRGRLEGIVAMACFPEEDTGARSSWVLWLDLWAQAARHPEVASVRQESDDRWRRTISSLVLAGQATGEFGPADGAEFATMLSALLDGLAIQTTLGDPSVNRERAFELSMRFAAAHLGFTWTPGRRGRRPAL